MLELWKRKEAIRREVFVMMMTPKQPEEQLDTVAAVEAKPLVVMNHQR